MNVMAPVKPEPLFKLGVLVDVYVEHCNVTIPRGIVASRRLSKDGIWWYVIDCTAVKVAARELDVTPHRA